LSKSTIQGCFYLDSCVVLSEVLGQNKTRMGKFKQDVRKHGINCYVSPSVVTECEYLIKNTINFLDFVLKRVVIVYLEGITTKPRDLNTAQVSNEDLHLTKEAFMTVNQTARQFDLLTDPFQAIEEWLVEKLDAEVEKTKKGVLGDFVISLTATILEEITKLESAFETLVDLEASYISKSTQSPCRPIVDLLVQNGIHTADAVHISVVESHQRSHHNKAVFLTFDYKTILLKWTNIQRSESRLRSIFCCDPIYGLSHLR